MMWNELYTHTRYKHTLSNSVCAFSGAVNVSAKMCDVQKGKTKRKILYKHITAAATAAAFYEPDEMCREILSIFFAGIFASANYCELQIHATQNNITTGINATIESERTHTCTQLPNRTNPIKCVYVQREWGGHWAINREEHTHTNARERERERDAFCVYFNGSTVWCLRTMPEAERRKSCSVDDTNSMPEWKPEQ